MTRIAWLGNADRVGAPESTESHWQFAFESLGVEFIAVDQRAEKATWEAVASGADAAALSTSWGWPVACDEATWNRIRGRGVRTFSAHLDLVCGLPREQEILRDQRHPQFYGPEIVWSSDGGHPEVWESLGIDHRWMPPAIHEPNAVLGDFQEKYRARVAFIGSDTYHPEWEHRPQMVQWLHDTYGDDFRHWGGSGEPGIRGRELCDVMASVDVIVGDSCFIDSVPRYFSDRTPETLGRGGFLIHAHSDTYAERFPSVPTWNVGDWNRLRDLIDQYLDDAWARDQRAIAGRAQVLAEDTYTIRAAMILDTLGLDYERTIPA